MIRLSLRNRLASVFFAITLIAIAALYLYVAPGLQTRLINQKRSELAAGAQRYSGPIADTIGERAVAVVRDRVDAAALASGDRVTLFVVSQAPGGPQLSPEADSSKLSATTPLSFRVARQAADDRVRRRRASSRRATAPSPRPPTRSIYQGRVGAVIVYSDPVSDIVHSVEIVRHEILVAGGIALLLALIGGYLVTRALGERVKRLELAAEKVAAGDFDHPIQVDSSDELGQLAIAFNQMQRQLAQLE